MVKPVSPYLQRPLRSLEEALRELGQDDAGEAKPEPVPPGAAAVKPGAPQDSVRIAGVAVAVEPGEPAPPATGGQLDVTA